MRCFNSFNCPESRYKHIHVEICNKKKEVVVRLLKNEKLKFKNHRNKMTVPFVCYADFECFTKKIKTCENDPGKSFTKEYQKHEPSGYCI